MPLTRMSRLARPGLPLRIVTLSSARGTSELASNSGRLESRTRIRWIGSQIATLPAPSVARISMRARWVWSILVEVTTTGAVVPGMKGGTTVSAFSDRITTIETSPEPLSWNVVTAWAGGPENTVVGQVGGAGGTSWMSPFGSGTRKAVISHSRESGFWPAGAEFICTTVLSTLAGTLIVYRSVVHCCPSGALSSTLNRVGLLLTVVLSGRSGSPSPANSQSWAARADEAAPWPKVTGVVTRVSPGVGSSPYAKSRLSWTSRR